MNLRRLSLSLLILGLAAAGPRPALADADSDWAKIVKLDAGPSEQPSSREEALQLAHAHFARHSAAIDAFIAAYPNDHRVLDAKLRLLSIRAALGEMDLKPLEVRAALLDLMALEKSPTVPRNRLPDVAYRRITLQMQTLDGTPEQMRDAVITAARNFAIRFPEDKRAPRLLVEAATQCDDVPDTMRELLDSAQSISREPALNARIADDLRRLNTLGQPVDATFSTIQGGKIDLGALRGNVVVLLFWAANSTPSLLWMQQFQGALANLPMDGVRIIMISLDEQRKDLDEAIHQFNITWPINFDGRGWENAVARPLGINAIPTVWILDKKGILRTLNARESYGTWIRRLQRER